MLAARFATSMGALFLSIATLAADISLASPDGNIEVSFRETAGLPAYSIAYRGVLLVDTSSLDMVFREPGNARPASFFGSGMRIRYSTRQGLDSYTLPVGRNSTVSDPYNELAVSIEETGRRRRRLTLEIRAYNDGVAFRWVFPRQPNWEKYELLAENTAIRFNGDPFLQASFLPGYTSSHEGRYTRQPFSLVKSDTLMDMPVFLEWPGKGSDRLYMAITEARLVDYAGMYLIKHKGQLISDLSPLPNGHGVRVKAILPHQTPWRVLLVGPRPGAFLESNLLTDLNDPCAIHDLTWLKPGKTDFHWWNGDIVPDTSFAPGINFETNQYYIDFCAHNGIDYHTVIGYGGTAWYRNDGVSYSPGPHSDVTRPVPGLDMKQICNYAAAKGVGVRVWVHWQVLWPNIDKAFTLFEQWGIKGMMVDFMDRDDQQMVNIQTAILRKAAAHHLHIQFHGAYKPTGLIRTWPNELTREGTLNYENDKWDNPISPEDDLNIVFTRLVAGATDYHLGGFRAVPRSEYRAQYTRPLVLGTRCHMLAMYVVLESYLPMVCDYPSAYEGQEGFDFIRAIPASWNETRVPAAMPGEWATVARRKGTDWYVGTINGPQARTLQIPLQFLAPGRYQATIYSDAADAAEHPNHLIRSVRIVEPTDSIQAVLPDGGGQAIELRKL